MPVKPQPRPPAAPDDWVGRRRRGEPPAAADRAGRRWFELPLGSDQQAALDKLQKAAWQRYQENKEDIDGKPLSKEKLKERLETYPFTVSKQWRLAPAGLVFLYQPGEMDDWVAGPTEITVPAAELKDIIKPEFIKEMASWQDTPPEKDQDDLPKATAKPQWRQGE